MLHLIQFVQRLKNDEKGQALTEYGLIIALVAIALVITLGLLGDELITVFTNITDDLTP